MKALRIPAFVLIALLCACLCSSIRMTQLCKRWSGELEDARAAVEAYDFDTAVEAMEKLETDWEQWQVYLHITIEHEELDDAQELLRLCRLQAEESDHPGFLIAAARLQTQFALLQEMEQLSIKNVL